MSQISSFPDQLKAKRALATVSQFCRVLHPELTESALRWLIHCSKPRHASKSLVKPNGFDKVIVRRGRRVYLDDDQYYIWLDAQQTVGRHDQP